MGRFTRRDVSCGNCRGTKARKKRTGAVNADADMLPVLSKLLTTSRMDAVHKGPRIKMSEEALSAAIVR